MSAVVQVITALERGGAQRVALEMAARLHREDRPQHLVTGSFAALGNEARARLGRRLHLVPDLGNALSPARDVSALFALQRAFSRLLAHHGELLVHTHSSKAGVLGRLAARSLRGVRVVHTVHGFGFDALGPRARPLLLAAERVAGAATDALVFVSDSDRALADELRLGLRASRHTVRAGVDEERFRPASDEARREARARFGIPLGAPLALTVANLKPQKDPLFHVEALAAWRRARPEAQLLFLGDGLLRGEVETRAHALGVRGALSLPGFVDDVSAAYAAADVFLLASRWEGLPCAALEALAAGLPVVVRDAGWAGDLGFSTRVLRRPPSASPDDVARALEDALVLGRSVVRLPRPFTLEGMLEQLDALYDDLLG